ncbi:hypothetical protein KXW63_009732, partial [Aspergillus fumigatus]
MSKPFAIYLMDFEHRPQQLILDSILQWLRRLVTQRPSGFGHVAVIHELSYRGMVGLHQCDLLGRNFFYLHRITDICMQGSAKKNMVMFKQLCGQDVLKMVILVTMMWEASTAEGQSCEWELINTIDFWGR